MNILRVGPLLIDLKLLFVIAAAIAGYLTLKGRKGKWENEDAAVSIFVNAFVIGLLVWKLSPILFDIKSIVQHPISLLYFNGGQRGVWLGIAVAIFYTAWRMHRLRFPFIRYGELLLMGWTAGMGIYYLLSTVAFDRETIFHMLASLLNIVMAGYFLIRRSSPSSPAVVHRLTIWYFLAMFGLPFFREYREGIVIGFSLEQLIWGTFIFIAYWAHFNRGKAAGKES
ncbi:hypothetical protein [Paenibacillus chungangensis]|uniref:Prolipoprotein diacylglyceryl transferase n=1 Tax=Paenibacillus chungangensis TaxID=696535 RepID=A0ABW3HN35_9BACL